MSALAISLREFATDLRARLENQIGGKDIVVSDRLKALIAAAGGVLLISALLGMHHLVGTLESRYLRAQTDLTRLKTQIETNVWQGRKQQSQVLKSVLEERLWTAQTPGLADASFERWLRERMSRYKMEPSQQIQVRRVPVSRPSQNGGSDPLANIQRMTAKIVLPFDPAGLANFLADIAEGDKTVVVDRLSVRAGRNARVEIDVSAFFWTREKS